MSTAPLTATTTVNRPATSIAQGATEAYKAQRLTKAAHQFEAMLLGEMLKPLGKTEDEAMSGAESSGSNPLQSLGVEAVAGALANSGALGFARQIAQALQSHRPSAATAAPTGGPNNRTNVSESS